MVEYLYDGDTVTIRERHFSLWSRRSNVPFLAWTPNCPFDSLWARGSMHAPVTLFKTTHHPRLINVSLHSFTSIYISNCNYFHNLNSWIVNLKASERRRCTHHLWSGVAMLTVRPRLSVHSPIPSEARRPHKAMCPWRAFWTSKTRNAFSSRSWGS